MEARSFLECGALARFSAAALSPNPSSRAERGISLRQDSELQTVDEQLPSALVLPLFLRPVVLASPPRQTIPAMSSRSSSFPPPRLLLAPLLAACGTSSAPSNQTPPPPGSVAVSVSPASANIRAGSTYMFTAPVTGSSNTAVSWSVNSTPGGSPTLGTIDSSGNYTAPITLPSPNTVSVPATSAADPT